MHQKMKKLLVHRDMKIDCESRRVFIADQGSESDGQGIRSSGASGKESRIKYTAGRIC